MDRSQWDHVLGVQFPAPAVTGVDTAHRLQELFTANQPSPLAEQLLGASAEAKIFLPMASTAAKAASSSPVLPGTQP